MTISIVVRPRESLTWEKFCEVAPPHSIYGVANKRVYTRARARKSEFNSKPRCREALQKLVEAVQAPNLIVSFSNEGFVTRDEVEEILSARRYVTVLSFDNKRYVGAQIGIHNAQGEKVGAVSHLSNLEHLFIATPEPLSADFLA